MADPQETALADAIQVAWNTPPWNCTLDLPQQRIMARIAARTALDAERDEWGLPTPVRRKPYRTVGAGKPKATK